MFRPTYETDEIETTSIPFIHGGLKKLFFSYCHFYQLNISSILLLFESTLVFLMSTFSEFNSVNRLILAKQL